MTNTASAVFQMWVPLKRIIAENTETLAAKLSWYQAAGTDARRMKLKHANSRKIGKADISAKPNRVALVSDANRIPKYF
jgi:hypothetical protein